MTITSLAPDLFDLQFVSETQAWACGVDGYVTRYENGHWNQVPQNLRTYDLRALHPRDAVECWFAGGHGTVLHYKDGEWINESPLIDEDLYGIRVYTKNNGWLVGDGGRILKRQDGGWVQVTSPVQADYRCTFFVNDHEGWFGASSGYVVHLKNGGLTKTRLPSSETVLGLYFKQDGRGYAVTQGGNIYVYGPNAGWSLWFSSNRQLHDITYPVGERGWAVGAKGKILKH